MMEVQEMKLADIRPYEKNPRRNDDAVDAVVNSIKEFGWQQPIVVDKDMKIIVGHTRYKAAKKLKCKTVPVVVADNLTEEQVRAYRIADNSTNALATWDFDLLLGEIQDLDYDFGDFGLNLTDTEAGDDLDPDDIVEDDYEPPEELAPVVKLGEIWRCGDHVLLCGDATSEEDVRKLVKMGGGK
jgi:site-specific DNA-methyltransferase (adenine-specific)